MLTTLLAIFSAIGIFVKFIKNYLVKYLVHSVILTLQFSVAASSIVFVGIFYAFAITALVSVFNAGIDIMTYASSSGLVGLGCFVKMLNCVGILPAMQNGFTLFYASLSSIVIFHLMKFTFSAMKMIMNEIFKLGVLLGQAVN